ncbi:MULTISPECIES: GyrI-like domain-containing protein [Brevibacterium]|uniref:GyrI-like domain-containing protein n=1 Tax=Brevibacterium casei TaxID=33889 RepID=A0A7T4A052_9MICO|nr:GyrI-like domain-containing protein [Brevibacterium casei]QQB14853.1 GyrI-like domain-containing protein [Brevibacterium casei]
MDKIDLKKTLPSYRARHGEFDVIEVPPRAYLMINGHGDPNTSPEFTSAVESLYPLAYALKFLSKRELGRDYVVPPLEGLWWAADMSAFTTARDKSAWDFTLMLLVPNWLDRAQVEEVAEAVERKSAPPRLRDVRFETLDEGTCVQTLHIGPFDAEAEVLARLHDEVIPDAGLMMTGKHHEIYLSDFRRTAPERLRTILRQPVRRRSERRPPVRR